MRKSCIRVRTQYRRVSRYRKAFWGVAFLNLLLVLVACFLEPVWTTSALSRVEEDASLRMHRAMALFDGPSADRRCPVLGKLTSSITSKVGMRPSKEATCDTEFASLLVRLYAEAGLEPGDQIGVAFSGSFPALNIATLVSAEAYGLEPIVISSLSSSMFGANRPDLTWMDMEARLHAAEIIHTRSVAASLGGWDDNGKGLPQGGRVLLRQNIQRHGIPMLRSRSIAGAVRARLRVYRARAGDDGVKAYVNVGGGRASVGTKQVKHAFLPGLNRRAPDALDHSGVMPIMMKAGVPVIYLGSIRKLCQRHELRCAGMS